MPDNIGKRKLALQRKSSLWTERSSFLTQWQELSRFMLPRSGRFTASDRNKGDKRYNAISDNTATRALRVATAGLMSGASSPARPWMKLGTRDKELMQYESVKQWLDTTTSLMLDIFNKSNTYRALHSSYEEIITFATAATVVQPDYDSVIRHYPLTVGEYALACNDRQEVDTLVREFDMTVGQIVKRFVATNTRAKSGSPQWDNVSQSVKSLYDRGNLDAWVRVMHIIEPREDRMTGDYSNKNMPWKSCIFEMNATEELILSESGYKRFPVMVPRWHVIGGDVYGTSCPSMEALGDTKQLQHAQLRKSQGLDYMVKPPLQAPAGTKAYEVDLLPGGLSITNMTGPNTGIRSAFDVRLDLRGQLEDIRDVRQRINSAFYVDLFMMIAADNRNDRATAREIAEKHEEKMMVLGPVLERLHDELLGKLIEITFDQMIEANMVPPPPEEMNGQELSVEFISVLAQAQRAIGTNNVDRYVMALGTIAQFKPGVLDKFNEDTWADKYAEMMGVDPDFVNSNDKVAIVREQRAKAQQAQAQLAMAQQAAETAKTASQADTSGQNGLTDVLSGLTGYSGPGLPNAI